MPVQPIVIPTDTDWQQQLANAVSDAVVLLRMLGLDLAWLSDRVDVETPFRLRVPHTYIARMRHGDPDDPLLLQVLPARAEAIPSPGFSHDPVGDHDASITPGLLHKYRGRVLLLTTGACGIHCRYCFCRHFPYAEANPARSHWQEALAQISADTSIEEVILSVGDPLSLSDARLRELSKALDVIPHLRRLRIHSRLPVVLPARITPGLLQSLEATRLQTVMVIHANHAHEFDAEVDQALDRLRKAGVTLLNQSVLLKGVNDSSDALAALSERMFQSGVLPYYLHLLDRVQGAAHFEVPEAQALALMAELRACLPGYLVPRLVREETGKGSKTPIIDTGIETGIDTGI